MAQVAIRSLEMERGASNFASLLKAARAAASAMLPVSLWVWLAFGWVWFACNAGAVNVVTVSEKIQARDI